MKTAKQPATPLKANAGIVQHVFAVIERDGLIAKARGAAEDKERQRQSEARESERQHRIKEAGPRLFAALLHLEQAYSNKHSPQHREAALNEARALLRELGESA